MRFRLRTLLILLAAIILAGCFGNFSSGSSKNLTPPVVQRGEPVAIKIQLVILGVGSETPERSYADEKLFVRFDRTSEFKNFPLNRTVPNDEVLLEASIPPETYGESEAVEFYVRLKCDGVENRLPREGQHEVTIEPSM
jgi:hypothetical protein